MTVNAFDGHPDLELFTIDGRTFTSRDAYVAELTRRVLRKHTEGHHHDQQQ